MQYLYQWSLNRPSELRMDLHRFFKQKEGEGDRERDYYSFAEELITGTIDHFEEIDEVIKRYAKNWDFARVARIDLAILRLAIYEMLYRRDIPPVVSINEAIEVLL